MVFAQVNGKGFGAGRGLSASPVNFTLTHSSPTLWAKAHHQSLFPCSINDPVFFLLPPPRPWGLDRGGHIFYLALVSSKLLTSQKLINLDIDAVFSNGFKRRFLHVKETRSKAPLNICPSLPGPSLDSSFRPLAGIVWKREGILDFQPWCNRWPDWRNHETVRWCSGFDKGSRAWIQHAKLGSLMGSAWWLN